MRSAWNLSLSPLSTWTWLLLVALHGATASPAAADGVPGTCSAPQKYRARLFREANNYVKQHGLVRRAVVLDVKGQKVVRLFVPILDQAQRSDFEERFSKKNNSVLWAQGQNFDYYAKLITEPDKQFFRFNPGGDDWTVTPVKDHYHTDIGSFTKYIAMELEPEKIAALEAHFSLFDTRAKWRAARPEATLAVPDRSHGECMWWMGSAETELGKPLWGEFGVKRSVAPENLRKRLLHLGNQRVSVVGVPVASLERFKAMSTQDLLGEAPMTRGLDGQPAVER